MKPPTILIVAGEPSGDLLAAEVVEAIRVRYAEETARFDTPEAQPSRSGLAPRFFGAGGPQMAAAGVECLHDLTQRSVIGLSDALGQYSRLKAVFDEILATTLDRLPELVVLVDFSYFNHKLASAIRGLAKARNGPFQNWTPRIVKYVSPQVWASRPGRARKMAEQFDLLLCLFPFEKPWYALHSPTLHVEYVGHPVLDRYPTVPSFGEEPQHSPPKLLLLPGSRMGELARHIPPLLQAVSLIRARLEVSVKLILPSKELGDPYRTTLEKLGVEVTVGGLREALSETSVAIASTGSVTMECARFCVPTIAFYKTSWLTYQAGKRLITVRFLAMPNLLADKEIMPEFIQEAATPKALATSTLRLLEDPAARRATRRNLAGLMETLGEPGAPARAAAHIVSFLLQPSGACKRDHSRP